MYIVETNYTKLLISQKQDKKAGQGAPQHSTEQHMRVLFTHIDNILRF
jgi:hypothetical protein